MINNLNLPKVYLPEVILKNFNYQDFINQYYVTLKETSKRLIQQNLIINLDNNSYILKNAYLDDLNFYIYNNGCNDIFFSTINHFNKSLFLDELTKYLLKQISTDDQMFLNNLLNSEAENYLMNESMETYRNGHSLFKKLGMLKMHLMQLKIIDKNLLFKNFKTIDNVITWEINSYDYINKYKKIPFKQKISCFINAYFNRHEQNNKFLKILAKDIARQLYIELLLDKINVNSFLHDEIKKTSIKIQVSNSLLLEKLKNSNQEETKQILNILNQNSLWGKIVVFSVNSLDEILKFKKPEYLIRNIIFPRFLKKLNPYNKNQITKNKQNKIFKFLTNLEDKKLLKLLSYNQKIKEHNVNYTVIEKLIYLYNGRADLNYLVFKNHIMFNCYLNIRDTFEKTNFKKNNIIKSLTNFILKNKNVNTNLSKTHNFGLYNEFYNFIDKIKLMNKNQRNSQFAFMLNKIKKDKK